MSTEGFKCSRLAYVQRIGFRSICDITNHVVGLPLKIKFSQNIFPLSNEFVVSDSALISLYSVVQTVTSSIGPRMKMHFGFEGGVFY